MFEEIFFPRTAQKHRAAPLAELRARYLSHLKKIGTSRATLRKCANDHLHLVRILNLREGERISIQGVEAAATIWSHPNGRRCDRAATAKTRQRFVSHCVDLLRFLGWIEQTDENHHPHHAEVRIFGGWLRNDRGLSDATIDDYCRAADHLFVWLDGRGTPLDTIQMADVDELMAAEHRRGTWNRRTIHDYAQRLRRFLAFAEERRWCRPGLAAGIMAPSYMADETVSKGVKREDVERLLASVQDERPVDRRDRAILMLFVAYGLRAGEVAGLRLDDLDWENEIVRVRCPKPGRTHVWPLSPAVGHAILRYITEARPAGHGRSLFFTSRAPIRPVSRKTSARSSMIASQASASSAAVAVRMRCGMLLRSIFWTRACP